MRSVKNQKLDTKSTKMYTKGTKSESIKKNSSLSCQFRRGIPTKFDLFFLRVLRAYLRALRVTAFLLLAEPIVAAFIR
jgi:hypothetical protein